MVNSASKVDVFIIIKIKGIPGGQWLGLSHFLLGAWVRSQGLETKSHKPQVMTKTIQGVLKNVVMR